LFEILKGRADEYNGQYKGLLGWSLLSGCWGSELAELLSTLRVLFSLEAQHIYFSVTCGYLILSCQQFDFQNRISYIKHFYLE
jgi:hypothetical protein